MLVWRPERPEEREERAIDCGKLSQLAQGCRAFQLTSTSSPLRLASLVTGFSLPQNPRHLMERKANAYCGRPLSDTSPEAEVSTARRLASGVEGAPVGVLKIELFAELEYRPIEFVGLILPRTFPQASEIRVSAPGQVRRSGTGSSD